MPTTSSATREHAFSFNGNAARSTHAGELRFDMVRSNPCLSGDTSGNGTAVFAFRLDHVNTLNVADFVPCLSAARAQGSLDEWMPPFRPPRR